jgi:protein-tyrosine-phosphatase
MKILFVCKGNNCRSQIAEALYNRLTNSTDASSAGTQVEGIGDTLSVFGKRPGVTSFTLDVMHDAGFDLRNKIQTQLTQDMPEKYNLVVNMAAEESTPAWLSLVPNYRYWKIDDPAGVSYEVTANVKRLIENNIHELIEDSKK